MRDTQQRGIYLFTFCVGLGIGLWIIMLFGIRGKNIATKMCYAHKIVP
jgi:hypothetical protein